MRNTEHLPYQTEKNNRQTWFYKKSCSQKFCVIHRETSVLDLFFIKLQTVRPATLLNRDSNAGVFLLRNFWKTPFWRTFTYGCFWTDFTKWLFGTLFLGNRFENHSDSVILQIYQSLSNQSFTRNSLHLPSLRLTSTLSFEHRFCLFIIDSYWTKSKRS